tara:strand:- start:29060 stop:29272 length:213 start_codon:yes stop_codon:yes gene_type:complete
MCVARIVDVKYRKSKIKKGENNMIELLTSNWEYILLALYVLEKGVKLSPSKKDDVIFDMVIKPIIDKIKK